MPETTLPVLVAFLAGNDKEKTFWRRTIEDLDQRPGDLERAIDLVTRCGALAETAARAGAYASAASRALGAFADGPERLALAAAARFAGNRRF